VAIGNDVKRLRTTTGDNAYIRHSHYEFELSIDDITFQLKN